MATPPLLMLPFCPATGASPKPRLSTVPARPDSLWLVCEVDGAFPEPKVEFLDGAGTRILPEKNQSMEEDGRYHIKASIHVTKTDDFTCEVTQEQIHHRTSASTSVLTCGPSHLLDSCFWSSRSGLLTRLLRVSGSDTSTGVAGRVGLQLDFITSLILNLIFTVGILWLLRRRCTKWRRSAGTF